MTTPVVFWRMADQPVRGSHSSGLVVGVEDAQGIAVGSAGVFHLRVAGIGPQIGYLFPAGEMQGYVNLKGYKEFAAENRPEGWNVWLTLAFSPVHHQPAAGAVRR